MRSQPQGAPAEHHAACLPGATWQRPQRAESVRCRGRDAHPAKPDYELFSSAFNYERPWHCPSTPSALKPYSPTTLNSTLGPPPSVLYTRFACWLLLLACLPVRPRARLPACLLVCCPLPHRLLSCPPALSAAPPAAPTRCCTRCCTCCCTRSSLPRRRLPMTDTWLCRSLGRRLLLPERRVPPLPLRVHLPQTRGRLGCEHTLSQFTFSLKPPLQCMC